MSDKRPFQQAINGIPKTVADLAITRFFVTYEIWSQTYFFGNRLHFRTINKK